MIMSLIVRGQHANRSSPKMTLPVGLVGAGLARSPRAIQCPKNRPTTKKHNDNNNNNHLQIAQLDRDDGAAAQEVDQPTTEKQLSKVRRPPLTHVGEPLLSGSVLPKCSRWGKQRLLWIGLPVRQQELRMLCKSPSGRAILARPGRILL